MPLTVSAMTRCSMQFWKRPLRSSLWHLLRTSSLLFCSLGTALSIPQKVFSKGTLLVLALLFCLTIHDLIGELKSEIKVFYLDNGTLGDTLDDVQSDLLHLERIASEFNLFLNHSKSEIICKDEQSKLEMLSRFPSLHPTVPSRAVLLGSPIGGTEANSGGLGIRSATMLAPSAFLASAAGTFSISLALLSPRLTSELATCTFQLEALRLWNSYHPGDPPSGSSAGSQKAWDTPIVDAAVHLLTSSADSTSRARLLAAQQKESGAWLSAPPISSLGLRLHG